MFDTVVYLFQARRVEVEGEGPTGLIPSHQLEEKRKAFVQPDYDYSKSSLCKLDGISALKQCI